MTIILGIALCIIFFLFGINIGRQRINYQGHISILETESGGKQYVLELDGDPEDIDQMKSVTFRVGDPVLRSEVLAN